jgi:hypothetical protein
MRENRFLELADSASVLICTDDHGNVEFANKTYLKYFEVALEGVAGQRWKDLVHPDDYESYIQQFLAASIARRSFRSEARGRRGVNGDGLIAAITSWLRAQSVRIRHEPGGTSRKAMAPWSLVLSARSAVGTKLTWEQATKLSKPVLHIYNARKERMLNQDSLRLDIQALTDFLCSNKIEILNVAGPRESKEPGVYEWTLTLLRLFLNRALIRMR